LVKPAQCNFIHIDANPAPPFALSGQRETADPAPSSSRCPKPPNGIRRGKAMCRSMDCPTILADALQSSSGALATNADLKL
jgi:hypothetical protein